MEMVIFEPWVKNAIEGIEYKMPELRDLFAMSAMNAILNAGTQTNLNELLNERQARYHLNAIPEAAYKLADAMLAARKVK